MTILMINFFTPKDHLQSEKCLLTDLTAYKEKILKIRIPFFTQLMKS